MRSKYCIILITVALSSIIISCKRDAFFKNDTVKKLSQDESNIPDKYGGLILFVSVDSNQVGKMMFTRIQALYSFDYSNEYNRFERFLSDALNQRKIFSRECIENRGGFVFKIDESITKEYDLSGISPFIKKHCEEIGGSLKIKKDSLNKEELFSIMYFLAINNYMVELDDVLGTYFVEPF